VSTPTLRSRIVSGFFWLAATKAVGQAVSWVITLFVVRLLAPEDYGLMGLALLATRFLLLFNELGLGAAIVQRRELTDRQVSDVTWLIFLVNLALFALLFALAPALGTYFDEPALVDVIRLISTVFVINGFGAASGFLLQRQMAFRQKAAAEVVGNAAGGLATLLFALAGKGVWSLVLGHLIAQVATNAMYVASAPPPLDRRFSLSGVRDFIEFGSKVAFGKVFWWISTSADAAIVGRVLGTIQLGYYGLAVQLATLPLDRIVSLIAQVALPAFSAVQHDEERLRRHYAKMVGAIALVTFPVFIGMALVADDGVRLILTERWTPIVDPLRLLGLTACLRAIQTMNTPALLAMNRPGIPLFNSFLQAVVLSLAFLVGTRWGITGVAVAWFVAWPPLYAIVTLQTLRALRLSLLSYVAQLRHPLIGSAAMSAVVVVAGRIAPSGELSLLGLVLVIAAGALAYFAYHALFNRQMMEEVLEAIRVGRSGSARSGAGRVSMSRESLPGPGGGSGVGLQR